MHKRQSLKLLPARLQQVVPSRRPFPLRGSFTEVPTTRIAVDVVHRSSNGLRRIQVSVVPGRFLTKPKTGLPLPSTNRQLLEQWGTVGLQNLLNLRRERLLQPSQVSSQLRLRSRRRHQQVNVLRHEHKSYQFDRLFSTSGINRLRQPSPPVIVGSKWLSSITRERQLVNVSRLMKSFRGLPVRHRRHRSMSGTNRV